MTLSRVQTLVKACGFEKIADLSATAVETYLADRRRAGMSVQTSNHYLRAGKQFSRWLFRYGRTNENRLDHLKGGNVTLDRRHDRRDLSLEEINRLLDAAECSAEEFRGLTGRDRFMLYATALGTGFRAAELASLTPASFKLTADAPEVRVLAGYSKNRKEATQPVAPDLAAALADYLADIPKDGRVWPGRWREKASLMLRADLAAARLAWLKEAKTPDDQERRKESSFLAYCDQETGRFVDFHALRHTFISLLVSSGVDVKKAQELARHSSIVLTYDRYTHIGAEDKAAAVAKMPSLLASNTNGTDALKATGTDDIPLVAGQNGRLPRGRQAGVRSDPANHGAAVRQPLPAQTNSSGESVLPLVAPPDVRLAPACREGTTS
jgi:site-specific recombinase XerD